MRKLTWVIVLAALAWCTWWFVASLGLRSSVSGWLNARSAEGWQAEVSDVEGGGFPLSLRAGLTDLALADPGAGVAIATDRLEISAAAWWPGNVEVVLDDGPILLASPLGRTTLTMQNSIMALNLHPGRALELDALGWTAQDWSLTGPNGKAVQAGDLTLTMTQTSGPTYELVARANTFAPGDAFRRALRLPEGFPRAFDSLQMQATVTFDTEWNRRALDTRRPQPRQITLHLAEARWGDLHFNLAADLSVDANGIANGEVALQAQNWRSILDLAEASGQLPAGLRRQVEGILGALARSSGNPEALDVTLGINQGTVVLGFIPLFPAPRFLLR